MSAQPVGRMLRTKEWIKSLFYSCSGWYSLNIWFLMSAAFDMNNFVGVTLSAEWIEMKSLEKLRSNFFPGKYGDWDESII